MKKKIIKYVLIVILIIIVLVIINYVRNYNILKDLKEKMRKLNTIEEYSYTLNQPNNVEITRSGNILKVKTENFGIITYKNMETGESIREDLNTGEKTYYSPEVFTVSASLVRIDLETQFKETLFSNFIITTKNINNEKCYKIKLPSLKTTFYVSAETGLVLAAIDNDKNADNNEETFYYEYKFDNIEKLDFESLKNSVKQAETKDGKASVTMNAIVVKVDENVLSVIDKTSPNSLLNLYINNIEKQDFKMGQEILVYYDGIVLTSFPGIIQNIEKIEIVKDDSGVQILDRWVRYCYNSRENVEIIIKEFTSSGITISISDRNEIKYIYPSEYTIKKQVRNENYTGVVQQIGGNTENSTAGAIGTGPEFIYKDMDKISDVDSKSTVNTIDNGSAIEKTIDWSAIYGTLNERNISNCFKRK